MREQQTTSRRKALEYELGGEADVERSPKVSPGRAEAGMEGRKEECPSQCDELEARDAGMGRGSSPKTSHAGEDAALTAQGEGEREDRSQRDAEEIRRQQVKHCRLANFPSGPRLAFEPCREAYAEHSMVPFWDREVSEQMAHDVEDLRLLLQNKSQQEGLKVGDMGFLLAKLMEGFEPIINTRCGQSSEGVFPLPLPSDLGLCGDHIPYLEAVIRGLNLLAGSKSFPRRNQRRSVVNWSCTLRVSCVAPGCLKRSGSTCRSRSSFVQRPLIILVKRSRSRVGLPGRWWKQLYPKG